MHEVHEVQEVHEVMAAAHPAAQSAAGIIPDERLSIEKRSDGAILVRVQSAGAVGERLPDAVFSFRCGDPQYAYWLGRLTATPGTGPTP